MMSKLIPAVVATFSLGLSAMGISAPAQAGVVVGVGLPAPYLGVGYGPYWYGRPYYRGYYGHGYAGRRWR
jgi:hypothetical protein